MSGQWIDLGKLGALTPKKLKFLRSVVGYYRFIDENGGELYFGKAVECNRGGIAKRLMDYIRPSDSARRHASGQTVHNMRDTVYVKALIIGNDQAAADRTNMNEKGMIEIFQPKLNVQHNRSNSSSASERKPSSSERRRDYSKSETAVKSVKQIGREAIETGIYTAAVAALIDGARSAVKNGLAYRDGQVDGGQALANIGEDAARSGARAGATGMLGVRVMHGAQRAGIAVKSNVATAVAAAVVEVGVTVCDFAGGKISAEEAGERIGETGCATVGGIYAGAVAGAVFGPAGAVVGSLAGYMVTAWIYQSCLAALTQARLAEEEAARLEALCAEAVQEWNRRRQEFESRMVDFLEERHIAFSRCFAAIDEALEADETDDVVAGLAQLAAMTGSALKFEGFEEFKQFMEQDPNEPLVI